MKFSVDKSKILSLVLHCCDVAHPSKPWLLHRRWTNLLLEEFFRQGDNEKELGLPYSPLCDRNNTLVAESQIGKQLINRPNHRPNQQINIPTLGHRKHCS